MIGNAISLPKRRDDTFHRHEVTVVAQFHDKLYQSAHVLKFVRWLLLNLTLGRVSSKTVPPKSAAGAAPDCLELVKGFLQNQRAQC